MVGPTSGWSVSTRPKPETGLCAMQSGKKAKQRSGGFANWLAAVVLHFSKSHVLVSRGAKVPMRAISGVDAERSK
jgi:hypothetical protein